MTKIKFRHKETGLFFCKAERNMFSVEERKKMTEEEIFRKSHLSEEGRVYTKMVSQFHMRQWIGPKHVDEFEMVILEE